MALTFVQRVKEFITGKKDIRTGTRLVINCEKLENRVALIESGLIEEYTLEMEQAAERLVPHLMRFSVPPVKKAP